MAIDLEAILRRLDTRQPNLGVNTGTPAGNGLTGMSPSGGGSPLPANLNPNYTGSNSLGLSSGGSQPPNYQNVDQFGFDQYYETQMDAIGRRLADAKSQYDLGNQRDQESYDRAVRDSQQQQELDAGSLLDRMANQGLLRSGIQVKAQTDLADSYQRRMADYERMFNEGKTNRDTEYSNFQRDLTDQKAGLQQERTRRQKALEEEQARLRAEQAQQNQLGQYTLPPGMTSDMFRDPNNTEIRNNYHQILNGGDATGGAPPGQDPNAPGAGDAYAAWDQPQSAVQAYLNAVYQQEQAAISNYLNALYGQSMGIPG